MKKIISIILILALVFSFAGCGEKPLAEDTFTLMMDELVDMDETVMEQYGLTSEIFGVDDEALQVIISIFKALEYEIIEVISEDDSATIEVKIIAIDYLKTMEIALFAITEKITSGEIDATTLTEEESMALVFQFIGDEIKNPNVNMAETTLTMGFTFVDDEWVPDMADTMQLMSAVLGGIM